MSRMLQCFFRFSIWLFLSSSIPLILIITVGSLSYDRWPDHEWNITAVCAVVIFIIDFIIVKKYWK